MKELTSVRLINWHLFSNEKFEVKNSTFLTGANGTGKSTIIDAIQIVLLGDTTGRNFNKAANDRTGRTLKGYLRCETGETAQGQILCLRPGRFTSYVALEFFDTITEKPFTLGIVFDCFEDDSEEHHFFYLNTSFPSNDFTNKELLDASQPRPLTYKELLKYCQESLGKNDYEFFDTNSAYKDKLKNYLGDVPEKFFSLFKKAVSFTPINDISKFITEFVCDLDYNIDITAMQTNIEQYKILEIEAKKIQVKIDALNNVCQAYTNYKSALDSLNMADYVMDRVNFDSASETLAKLTNTLESNEERILQIRDELGIKTRQEDELKSEKDSYFAKKVNSSSFSLSNSIVNKKNSVQEKISTLENNYNFLSSTLKNYISSYMQRLNDLSSLLTQTDSSFLEENQEEALEKFKDISSEFISTSQDVFDGINNRTLNANLLTEFQLEMASLHSNVQGLIRDLDSSIISLNKEKGILEGEIDQINEGRKPFPSNYLAVRAALESSLKERHSDAQISSYCDLVDIKNKRWTKTIEAFIFNQKFNFFVQERYYEEASKILATICRDYGYYSISIVDSEKLIDRDYQAKPNSVAEEIETDHEGARAYTNFLLGNVRKCETFAEARESGNGLLPNCTGYRNFASLYLNERRAEISFIGTHSSSESALTKKDEYSSLSKKLELYITLNNHLKNIASLEVLSTSETSTFIADINDMKRVDELNDEIDHLDEQLSEGELKDISSFDEKIRLIDIDLASIAKEKNDLVLEQGGLLAVNKELKEKSIPAQQALVNSLREKLTTFDQELVETKFDPFYQKALSQLSFEDILKQARQNYIVRQQGKTAAENKLKDLRKRYVITYNLSYDTENLTSNAEFDNELKNLQEVLLPSYLIKIEDSHKKAIKEFKDNFIYNLRNSFQTIKMQIDELNQALQAVKFGRDHYRFSVEPNKDYYEYYQMITDDLLLNIGDAEDVYLEKYKNTMDSLFTLITEPSGDDEGDPRAKLIENVQKFTDYRTYLVFDLLVRRGESETESSLARSFKRQSGGETQTPFYISILASFAQLYRTNDPDSNSIRLVCFDEAFSKMDGVRIKEAVGLLRKFGLQAILSTPSEKLRDLSKEVDLILVTHHDAKKKRSYIDTYQDKSRI